MLGAKVQGRNASSRASGTGTYCGRPPLDQARSSPHPEPTPPAVPAARCARTRFEGRASALPLTRSCLFSARTKMPSKILIAQTLPAAACRSRRSKFSSRPHVAVLEFRREVAAQRVLTAADRDRDCRLRKSGSDQQRDLVALPSHRDEPPSTPLRWPVRFREFLHSPSKIGVSTRKSV